MDENQEKWKFCLIGEIWFLEISDLEQFFKYKDKTNGKFSRALILEDKEKTDSEKKYFKAAEYLSIANQSSIFEGMTNLVAKMFSSQMDEILAGTKLYYNEVGGYNFGSDKIIKTIYSDVLLFPSFDEKDINIVQWGGSAPGAHFYATIGDVEINDIIDGQRIEKWDTYEEAYQVCLKYCNKA